MTKQTKSVHQVATQVKAYGTLINCDIELSLNLATATATRYQLELRSQPSASIKNDLEHSIHFYSAHGREVYLHSDREFNGSEKDQPWRYEVENVVSFSWLGGDTTIYYELDEQGNAELLGFWFIHLLLPLYFTLENKYDFLHAGAVEVDGRPILFIAPSMGGKSTLTDYFIQQGHTLISDDKVATFRENGQFMLTGSHPYHRPYRSHEDLGYRVDNFMLDFKPIHAIYQLAPVDADSSLAISEIEGYRKFDVLMPNYLFMFSYLRPRRLEYLATLLNTIRVFEITIPWNLERLAEVHDAITAQTGKLQ